MISILAINSWCDYVHRSMPTHNNLLTLAGLPAQVALLMFVNVRKFLVSLLILNRGAPSFSQALTYDSSPMNNDSSTMAYSSLISGSIVEVHCEATFSWLVQFVLWCRFDIYSKRNQSSPNENESPSRLFSVWSLSSSFLF